MDPSCPWKFFIKDNFHWRLKRLTLSQGIATCMNTGKPPNCITCVLLFPLISLAYRSTFTEDWKNSQDFLVFSFYTVFLVFLFLLFWIMVRWREDEESKREKMNTRCFKVVRQGLRPLCFREQGIISFQFFVCAKYQRDTRVFIDYPITFS